MNRRQQEEQTHRQAKPSQAKPSQAKLSQAKPQRLVRPVVNVPAETTKGMHQRGCAVVARRPGAIEAAISWTNAEELRAT